MPVSRRSVLAFVCTLPLLAAVPPAAAFADEPTAKALRLGRFYDGLDVETLWQAGVHIDWETGAPDGRPERYPGKHTHCSAFVAAAAKRLGIYILRPPQHGQVLLANAQADWLAAGLGEGWQSLPDMDAAQDAANRGLFVVASYHNHHDDRPGHIAIVRPSSKSPEAMAAEGPDVIQAGGRNYTRASLVTGFAGHPAGWRDHEIRYYAHAVDDAALR
ncbi:MAG: hypothetical protein P4L98_17860 [Ancalomicrobiaceae bacterium]|nr:hypothetical protein [Ancalomicrobiaceae bacterium]